MTDLNDSVVVVTGGATGIGRALAREAVRRGARVMLLDVSDTQDAVTELRAMGGTVEAIATDVCDAAAVERAAAETVARFGAVNIVCNNAGIAVPGRLQETETDVAQKIIQINVGGTFNVVHAFTSALKQSADAGRVAYLLNTGSEHSLGVPPHVPPLSVYTVTKYAVLGLTMTAHRDLSPEGIGVSMLAPGWTRTENVQAFIDSDPHMAAMIEPYVQDPAEVAKIAFDELLSGTRVIATNAHTRAFAMDHARSLMADIQRLPMAEPNDGHHPGSGDAAECPVVGIR